MDIEFHYYITFILCRKAGFDADQSYKIAYSSQYTDDNNYHYHVNLKDGNSFTNQISQTLDITKPSEKRKTIYPLFHFIPGGDEAEDACRFKCGDKDCFVTLPKSQNAQDLLNEALKSNNLYRIGIAIHAFADTWAHQNFLGYKDRLNAQKGLGTKLIPNIGHADFFHEPDKIHNKWFDNRLSKKFREIDNDERFLQAGKEIFLRLYKFNNPDSSEHQAIGQYAQLKLEEQLRDAMDESYFWGGSDKARRKVYNRICPELKLEKYAYHPNEWRYAAVEKREFEIDIFDKYWAKENFPNSDWYQFQKAVEDHKQLALTKFRPLFQKAGFAVYG
ncbi:MAG: hypothetical protein JSW39_19640 [Desulfobacterales bacterium]|nr:MAG: hypothetical protein JSW39_19640 [Desulfobacterales bacterium]